ncbi:hypothetical protein CTEN210_04327 [Chaetoceros tenuissimus]|uniref:MYND-type domain-containing protein n=1 Tax=Chaetoceros tenuissimus TaxID=426638 RepID=A0AAD3H2G0_9STRA|nr:hypothetical protein CTEN210_04327 [Chaetoceros tenuissimus]
MTQVNLGKVNFRSEDNKAVFRKEFEEKVESQKRYMDPHLNIYEAFQAATIKWPQLRNVCFGDCPFFDINVYNFPKVFKEMLEKFASPMKISEMKNGKLLQKFYSHPSAGQGFLKTNLQILLNTLLSLYQEMNTCWECNKLDGKALICASCKFAAYCCKECQVKHWNEGKHKDNCKNIGLLWSTYERRKKRVGRAIYKDKRVFAKPIKVNGIEKQCFLRPCEPLDYYLCNINSDTDTDSKSLDIFYENMTKMACGGKHLLFGDDTISSRRRFEQATKM